MKRSKQTQHSQHSICMGNKKTGQRSNVNDMMLFKGNTTNRQRHWNIRSMFVEPSTQNKHNTHRTALLLRKTALLAETNQFKAHFLLSRCSTRDKNTSIRQSNANCFSQSKFEELCCLWTKPKFKHKTKECCC